MVALPEQEDAMPSTLILTYNPYEMWATYGYPQFILYQNDPPRGCFWYDGTEVDDLWWYVCPPDGNLHSYEDAA
jgi:hypothetical protein